MATSSNISVSLSDYYGLPSGSNALNRHFNDLRNRPFLAGEDGVCLSLAGGQQKMALAVIGPDGLAKPGLLNEGDTLAIPMNVAPSTIIIKPDKPALAGIVENQAYCLTLAGMIGIPAAEVGIVNATGRTALAVARYDRTTRKNGLVPRLHQEDLAQANSVFPSQKYEQGAVRPEIRLNGDRAVPMRRNNCNLTHCFIGNNYTSMQIYFISR